MISEDNNLALLWLRDGFRSWGPPMNDILCGQHTYLNVFIQRLSGNPGSDPVAGGDSLGHFVDESLEKKIL